MAEIEGVTPPSADLLLELDAYIQLDKVPHAFLKFALLPDSAFILSEYVLDDQFSEPLPAGPGDIRDLTVLLYGAANELMNYLALIQRTPALTLPPTGM